MWLMLDGPVIFEKGGAGTRRWLRRRHTAYTQHGLMSERTVGNKLRILHEGSKVMLHQMICAYCVVDMDPGATATVCHMRVGSGGVQGESGSGRCGAGSSPLSPSSALG